MCRGIDYIVQQSSTASDVPFQATKVLLGATDSKCNTEHAIAMASSISMFDPALREFMVSKLESAPIGIHARLCFFDFHPKCVWRICRIRPASPCVKL
jgi:hypothetical protein